MSDPLTRRRRSEGDEAGFERRRYWATGLRWIPAMVAISMAIPFAGACSCGDDALVELETILDAPSSLDLGALAVGERRRGTVSLSSSGTGAVRLSNAHIEGDASGAFTLVDPTLPTEIAPGRELAIDVFFHPTAAGAHEARLEVESQDTEVGLSILLVGEGLVPRMVLCTEALCDDETEDLLLDLGGVESGVGSASKLRIENRGDALLRIAKVELAPGALAAGFRLPVEVDRATVAPGRHLEVPVTLLGLEQGLAQGALVVTANDPDRAEARAGLLGEGLVAGPPLACAGILALLHPDGSRTLGGGGESPRARPGDRVLFTAHPTTLCSAADGGRPLTYRWSLIESPESSGARLLNASAGPAPGSAELPPSLAIDAVGLYRIGLEVHDGARSSEQVELVVDARPEDDLTLELTWTVLADLDLHLVAPGGAPFCSPLDCFWDTCIGDDGAGIPLLDWGPDNTGDGRLEPDGELATNPILVFDNEGDRVVDEETGIRLETIRLQLAPTVPQGSYRCGVHYFADRGVTAESFEVILRLFRHGEQLLETRRTFDSAQVGWWWEAIVIDAESFEALAGESFEEMPAYVQPLPCP